MISEEKKIKLRDNEVLHTDIIEKGNPTWIIVTHGLGEHCGRHQYMHTLFSQYFNICLYDLRGHGKSSGKKAHVNSFKDYVEDLGEVIAYLKDSYSMDKFILVGHSMGALITSSYMQNSVDDNFYPEKVFLSSVPVAGPGLAGKLFQFTPLKFMHGLTSLPLSVPVSGLLDLTTLSHDPRVYETYVTDPLNSLKVHTKVFFEILTEGKEVFSRPLRIKCDLYCAVGSKDGIIDPDSTINYFTDVERNAKLLVIDGGYHELHNEVERFREPYFKFLKDSIIDD